MALTGILLIQNWSEDLLLSAVDDTPGHVIVG